MDSQTRIVRTLVDHFFRRFFDNDTVQVDADTQTTVVRALAIVMVPGMRVAFFLQNRYPTSAWLAMHDQYFFVLTSFVVMGAVSIFEWEMLFPDRLDFLVLSPLSVKPVQMLAAKAAALVASSRSSSSPAMPSASSCCPRSAKATSSVRSTPTPSLSS
jgi:hypothetical protein